MPEPLKEFSERLETTWLPSFCYAPHRNHSTDGFKRDSLHNLSEYDARWFLEAVDQGLVTESGGFFRAPQTKAKEQIFWTGTKGVVPRPLTLWVEPIITMGAVARLHVEFGWPADQLGTQSEYPWPFDLVGYHEDLRRERLLCEVKKNGREIGHLVRMMRQYADTLPPTEPVEGPKRNAYRKSRAIGRSDATVFWALGPGGVGNVFRIERHFDPPRHEIAPRETDALRFAER